MERKTQVTADAGKQEIFITREFDLPLDLLFKAYSEPDLIGEWMGTKVVKHENKKSGSYAFQTSDANGAVLFNASGVFHEFIPEKKIIRTFEMGGGPLGVQIEFLEFEKVSDDVSRLNMHIVYGSVAERDQFVQFGMTQGVNMAHNNLQKVIGKLKNSKL